MSFLKSRTKLWAMACGGGLALAASIAFADAMSDSAARLKIGQEALAVPAPVEGQTASTPDYAKAQKFCDAAIGGLPAKPSAESDMITADATECIAKALIGQGKNQEACDAIFPVLDMIGVSAAPGKADAKARLKAVLDPELAAKRCK
jgi:hypothetical protein